MVNCICVFGCKYNIGGSEVGIYYSQAQPQAWVAVIAARQYYSSVGYLLGRRHCNEGSLGACRRGQVGGEKDCSERCVQAQRIIGYVPREYGLHMPRDVEAVRVVGSQGASECAEIDGACRAGNQVVLQNKD